MLSVRKLGAVTSTILAVSVLASPASQAAPTDFAPLTVKKECSDFAGGVPRFCTIIASSFRALKKVKVLYYSPHLGSNGQFLSSDVVLDDGPRGTAIGHCIVYFAAGPAGICTFTAGQRFPGRVPGRGEGHGRRQHDLALGGRGIPRHLIVPIPRAVTTTARFRLELRIGPLDNFRRNLCIRSEVSFWLPAPSWDSQSSPRRRRRRHSCRSQ